MDNETHDHTVPDEGRVARGAGAVTAAMTEPGRSFHVQSVDLQTDDDRRDARDQGKAPTGPAHATSLLNERVF